MEKRVNTIQQDLHEYLLVAQPSAEVNASVLAEKEAFQGRFTRKHSGNSPAYITVASFQAKDAMEETIIRYTQRICSSHSSFGVELNNFSGYPPHTVYLRIQDPQPFKALARDLHVIDTYVTSCSCPPARLNIYPSLTIAKQLPEAVYLTALLEYSQRTFHARFVVDELVLLKRSNPYDPCKTVHVFGLQPQGYHPFSSLQYQQPCSVNQYTRR